MHDRLRSLFLYAVLLQLHIKIFRQKRIFQLQPSTLLDQIANGGFDLAVQKLLPLSAWNRRRQIDPLSPQLQLIPCEPSAKSYNADCCTDETWFASRPKDDPTRANARLGPCTSAYDDDCASKKARPQPLVCHQQHGSSRSDMHIYYPPLCIQPAVNLTRGVRWARAFSTRLLEMRQVDWPSGFYFRAILPLFLPILQNSGCAMSQSRDPMQRDINAPVCTAVPCTPVVT